MACILAGSGAGRGELARASCWPSEISTRDRPGTTRCGCALSGRERSSANVRSQNGNGSDVTLASSAPSRTDHPSFAEPGRKRKLLRGGGELPEECQVTLPILSDFQPRPTEQVKRGSAGERARPEGRGPRSRWGPGLSRFPVSPQTLRHGQHEQRARRAGAAGGPQDAAEGQFGGLQGWGQAEDPDGQPRRRRHLPLRGNQGVDGRAPLLLFPPHSQRHTWRELTLSQPSLLSGNVCLITDGRVTLGFVEPH